MIDKVWKFDDYGVGYGTFKMTKSLIVELKNKFDHFTEVDISFRNPIIKISTGRYTHSNEYIVNMKCCKPEYMDMFGSVLDYMEKYYGKTNNCN